MSLLQCRSFSLLILSLLLIDLSIHHSVVALCTTRNSYRFRYKATPTSSEFARNRQRINNYSFVLQSKFDLTDDGDDGDDDSDEGSAEKGKTRREILLQGSTLAGVIASGLLYNGPGWQVEAAVTPTTITISDAQGFSRPMIVPFSSRRKYKTVTLSNGLRVLLVSDKRAYPASAALSVGGAGQFSDPIDLPGLSHLLEHMVLSYSSGSSFRRSKSSDFEEWLEARDGSSNGFTAYDKVCFHFMVEEEYFGQALERFADLFDQADVELVCSKDDILKREIRRVSAELDFADELAQSRYYLIKKLFDPSHPYARFGAGNLDTLEKNPTEAGTDVARRLVQHFQERYQARNAVLVVVGSSDLNTLERWVAPFAGAMSRFRDPGENKLIFPKLEQVPSKMKQAILYRSKNEPGMENLEKLYLEWVLDLDYSCLSESNKQCITATQVSFVLSQILGRRGPGSLYLFMLRRGWIPAGMQGVPRISFAVNVSGFQLMKLEMTVTTEGFINRSAVVAAVYDCINSLRNKDKYRISRELIGQYATLAQLHGHILAPRPPDAIELAVDAQTFGIDLTSGIGSGQWWGFPLPTDRPGIAALQKTVEDTLSLMGNPSNAFIVATASEKTLTKAKKRAILSSDIIPPLSSKEWQREPITGARYCRQDFLSLTGKVEEWWFTVFPDENELVPPVLNPLIPSVLRPARLEGMDNIGRLRKTAQRNADIFQTKSDWKIFDISPADARLPMPRIAPEPSCRCAFVLQLLSTRPARANVKTAANGALWKASVEKAVLDLSELGAPAGLAYEISFNKFGMRLCFLGLSQNLASYVRRFCRRLVENSTELLAGSESMDKSTLEAALYEVSKANYISLQRKRQLASNLKEVTSYDAAVEGIAFFKSCNGAVCISQGDLLPNEVAELCKDLDGIFKKAVGSRARPSPAIPTVDDIIYRPVWKPRAASSCSVSGVSLVSNACGRVPR